MQLHYREKPSPRVFVVDDDALFRESLVRNLSHAGYTPVAFADGPDALGQVPEPGLPDVILLDWKMPGMDGIEVLRQLRQRRIETPVVFLTVLNDQIYEQTALTGGAVDFIDKSRDFPILSRRLQLILNGWKARDPSWNTALLAPIAAQGEIQLHRKQKRVLWKGKQIELTLTEFQIIEYMVAHAGHDIRYRDLYDLVHGEGFAAGHGEAGYRGNVRALIKRIRQKFRDSDPVFEQIENYPGFGYRWMSPHAG